MRIEASVRDREAVWHHAANGLLALGVWTEKKTGLGEDAPPLALHDRRTDRGMSAVFDGLGGAGASRAGVSGTGVERSHAWVAANGARALVEEWFVDAHEREAACDAEELRGVLADGLGELRGAARSKIFGTMRREMPTTMAALTYEVVGTRVEWQVLWAGDSRCYLLHPRAGLQQLSRDDTTADDALELLLTDPPMTNVINVSGPFAINENRGVESTPCLFVTATDGFFGYLNTPAEFEHLLLTSMGAAHDGADWARSLAEGVARYTGDDASLTVTGFGFEDFSALRVAFERRADEVAVDHVVPVRQALADREAFVAAREKSWRGYREDYERRMPRAPREGTS